MLKNKVTTTLSEIKNKKQDLLIEETIVRNRMLLIFESRDNIDNFKLLSEEKQDKIISSFITEVRRLDELGMVNEGFVDVLKSIFGQAFYGISETIVERIVNSFLTWAGMNDGFLKNFIVSFVAQNPARVIKALGDCRELTQLLSESLVEAFVMNLQNSKGFTGVGWDAVRNVIGNAIKEDKTGIVSKLSDSFEDAICNLISKFSTKAEDVVGKLRPAVSS